MKKLFLAAVAALFCAALSGCSVFETDTEALMHPPLLSEEQEKLNAALAQVAGENYTLKYPESGGSNSAFIFRDLDGDGEEEAMAFYSSVDESTRINVLKKDAEGWVSVYEAAGFSGDIKSIEFTFIDDKGEALIAKWADRIGVYRFAQNRLETIYTETCDGADITDINADGYSDVAVFKNNSADRSFFSVLFYNGTEMTVTEEIIVHAQYSNILSAKTGSLGNGKTAYFIDSSVYEGVYLTEIITLEEENAERYTIADFVTYEEEKEPEPEQEQEENVPTAKSPRSFSRIEISFKVSSSSFLIFSLRFSAFCSLIFKLSSSPEPKVMRSSKETSNSSVEITVLCKFSTSFLSSVSLMTEALFLSLKVSISSFFSTISFFCFSCSSLPEAISNSS